MKILFYFGHPAQYLFSRATIRELIHHKHEVKIIIKTKDVLETLLKNDGLEYENILPYERGKSKFSIALSLVKRTLALFPIIFKFKPDLMIGGDPTIAQLGKLLSIDRITTTEDDYEIIKSLADITNPFTQTILCPTVCNVGKWEDKKIGYDGYMKLGYLHPNIFKLDDNILDKYKLTEKYVVIRLAKLTAYHDTNIQGINYSLLDRFISIFKENGFQIKLSVEDDIDEKYHSYIFNINPSDMHSILGHASLLVSDSQSMSVEASILGVPSLRISSFTGRISVLEELENKYHLTYGFKPTDFNDMIIKLEEILSIENLKEEWKKRQANMLNDKIDVTAFSVWFIENYPKSIDIMKKEPDYQKRFK